METTTKFTPEQEEFIKRQQLSPEELAARQQYIIEKDRLGLVPSDRPIVFIPGGQPAGGKSAMIGYIKDHYGSNFWVIDNDDYRQDHPNVNEINAQHPETYTECTDQLSFTTTPLVVEAARKGRYNVILHQTLKNNTIVDNAIADFIRDGYTVVIMALAVHEITSNKDMIRRCQRTLELYNTSRWVPQENHDFAYEGLPKTVSVIEERGCYDLLEIVTRSEDENDLNNINFIYRKVNPNISADHLETLRHYGIPTTPILGRSAREAVIAGREYDAERTLAVIDEQLATATKQATTPEEFIRIRRLQEMLCDYTNQKAAKKDDE